MSDAVRQSKRFPSRQELRIRCETWSEFAALYASDVSQGGMFLLTDDPPPILSRIELRMALPEAHEIVLSARVVHVISPEQAQADGKQAGVGVEFVELDEVRRKQIHQLVEFARWEGSSDNASFARSMFERGGSISAADVLASLPPKHGGGAARTPAAAARSASGQVPVSPAPQATPRQHSGPVARGSGRPERRSSPSDPRKARRPRRPGETSHRSMPVMPDEPGPVEGEPAEQAAPESAASSATPEAKPTDMEQLKIGMKHFAHRRYHEAIEVFRAMLEDNPGDAQALKWLHMSQARISVVKDDEESAIEHYKRVLQYDEGHHEALKYVRGHSKRGLSLGRLFKRK